MKCWDQLSTRFFNNVEIGILEILQLRDSDENDKDLHDFFFFNEERLSESISLFTGE